MTPSIGIPEAARALVALLAPPRCIGCRRLEQDAPRLGLCGRCRIRLESSASRAAAPIPGIDGIAAATAYEGPALGLVAALKQGGVPRAAPVAADLLAGAVGPLAEGLVAVPVGASRRRSLVRGIDPAESLAAALAAALGIAFASPLARIGARRQRGRPRQARLGDPPRFRLTAEPPRSVLLIDDVLTTGGTLRSCAEVLRAGGTESVSAAVLARTPRPESGLARGHRMGPAQAR
ncbi:MAG TPA: phosphoribosyltransferase family protein [Solirubrobacterales bacterium]|nr:phosphoribosyltransferase family protein [Solirubrobacterales bacterium]